jgi:hypothetical protein
MRKPEYEFHAPEGEWHAPDGQPAPGIQQRLLSVDEDGTAYTRLLRFEPGADSSANGVQVHDVWEEVYIVEGDITDLRLGQTFTAGMYACRPPGMEHGPWRSESGVVMLEVRYGMKPS